jgi:predicted RNase H-like HicB family nuclease
MERPATPHRNNGLSCLLQRDAETATFVGHCLDYDLLECGKTEDDAWDNLKIVIKRHIEFCAARSAEGLNRQAKKERWDAFYEAIQRNPNSLRIETIEIDLSASLPENEIEMWIQMATIQEAINARRCPSPVV